MHTVRIVGRSVVDTAEVRIVSGPDFCELKDIVADFVVAEDLYRNHQSRGVDHRGERERQSLRGWARVMSVPAGSLPRTPVGPGDDEFEWKAKSVRSVEAGRELYVVHGVRRIEVKLDPLGVLSGRVSGAPPHRRRVAIEGVGDRPLTSGMCRRRVRASNVPVGRSSPCWRTLREP